MSDVSQELYTFCVLIYLNVQSKQIFQTEKLAKEHNYEEHSEL